jgi:hypothetical protein
MAILSNVFLEQRLQLNRLTMSISILRQLIYVLPDQVQPWAGPSLSTHAAC